MKIFDSHTHIYDEAFRDDMLGVLERAKEKHVVLMMLPSDNVESAKKVDILSKEYSFIYGAVGVHPSEVFDLNYEESEKTLKEIIKNNSKIKAIGEIGLDYYWHKEKWQHDMQIEWFTKQIKLANELHLPIIVHSRDACEDTLRILKENKPLFGCVYHCFSYSEETLKEILELGFFIGLDGPVTYKNSVTPKKVAQIVPLDRLLVETDAPYLTPVPFRGQRNEPSFVYYVVQEIAQLRGENTEYIAKATFENTCRLFGVKYE